MFEFVKRIDKDDIAVKLLFDHVRNIGIAAFVIAAAIWKHKNQFADHPMDSIFFDVFMVVTDVVTLVCLIVLGVFLYFVNMAHGVETLKKSQNPRWVFEVVRQTYAVVTVTIAYSLVGAHL